MKVPLLDLKAQLKSIEPELKQALLEVVDSTRYIMGPKVEELEKQIADYIDTKYAIGVSSGTDALLLALMALDIKAGDLVITTPYSFFATAGVISRLGAIPVFVDIDPSNYNLDPSSLSDWFKVNDHIISQVKAIVPVHLYGQCADMEAIIKICSKYQIPIIEDAAQAIGASMQLNADIKKAGSMSAFGCFSFFPSKNLGALGDAGIVVTSDPELYERAKIMRNHGAKPKYYHAVVGGNFRLDPIQAAALLVKLPHLDSWHKKRQENAEYYRKNLEVEEVKTPVLSAYTKEHIYNQFVISVSKNRDQLRSFLQEAGIGSEIYYPRPFHLQECFKPLGYKPGDFPQSEFAANHSLAIPIYPELSSEQQDYVIKQIKKFYE